MGVKIVLNPLKGNQVWLDINGKEKKSNLKIEAKSLKLKRTHTGTEFWVVPKGLLSVLNSLVDLPVAVAEEGDTENYILLKNYNEERYYLYPFEGVEVKTENVAFTRTEELNEHKVYETPEKVFEKVAEIIPDAYFRKVKELVRQKIEGNILSVVKEKRYAEEILKQFEEDPKGILNKLRGVLTEKDFAKVGRELDKYNLFLKALKEKNYGKLFEIGKEITGRELKDFTKKNFKIPLFDPQAGSGKILKVFKEKGLSAILFGTEIRNLKPDDPDNNVLYGVDFNLAYGLLKKEFENSKTFTWQIAYLNPPYRSSMEEERKSLLLLPNGMPVLGLFSHKAKKLLSANIEGLLIELPAEAVGYEGGNLPEKFIFVIGIKKNSIYKKQKIVSASSLEEVPKIIEENEDILKSFYDQIFEVIQNANRYNAKYGLNYNAIKNYYERINLNYKYLIEDIKTLVEINPEQIINNPVVSLKESLFAGEKVFPDLRIVNSTKKYSLFEVLSNPVMLKTYEQFVPSLYKFIIELAKEKNLPVAVAEESPYTTTENLGLMKYKHFPKVFEAKQIAKLFEKHTETFQFSEEDLKVLKELLNEAHLVGIKARSTLSNQGGEVAFGYTPVLVALDRNGKDLGLIEVDLSKFFKKLEEEGLVKSAYKLADPDSELKEKIVKAYIQHIDYVKKSFGIEEDDEKFFKETYLKLEEAPLKIVEFLKRKATKNDIVAVFNDVAKNLKIDNERVYKERLKKFLEAREARELAYTFRKLYGYLYTRFFEELLKSELTEKVKEKIQNEILKLSDVESEIKNSVRNSLKAEGKEALFKEIEPKLDKLINEFKERPFVFSYLQEKEDVERYLADPSVEEKKKQTLKSLPVYPNGSKAYLTKVLGDNSLAEAFLSGASAYVSLEDKVRNAVRRLFTQIFETEILKNINDPEKAFERFEKLFISKLGIKPHQFNEAIRLTAKKKLDGTKGHLLGWEMRSGKTLAMFLSGYFAYLGHDIKETFLFPKTANISDILLQMTEFLPQMLPSVKSYSVSTVDVPLQKSLVGQFLTTDIYPNLLAIDEVKRMLVGRGETQKELGKTYVKEMQDLIERFRKDPKALEKAKEVIKNDKHLNALAYINLPEDIKFATAVYLKRLKEKGLIEIDQKNLKGLLDKLTKLGMKIKREQELEEKHGNKPYRVHIIPKTVLDGVAYEIPRSQKTVVVEGLPLKVRNDVEFLREPLEKVSQKLEERFEGWFFPADLWEPVSQTLNSLEESFKQFLDREADGWIKEIISIEFGLPSEEAKRIAEELKEKARLNIEYKEFMKITEKDNKGQIVNTLEKPLLKFDVEGIEDIGEVEKERLKEVLLRGFNQFLSVWKISNIVPAVQVIGEVFTFQKRKVKNREQITNALIESLKKKKDKRGEIEIEVSLEDIPFIPLTVEHFEGKSKEVVRKENIAYKPFTVNYSNDIVSGEKNIYGQMNLRLRLSTKNLLSGFEVEVKGAPTPKDYPQTFSKLYFFNSKAFEERNYIAIVDEADEAINPEAQKYRAFLSIAKNSKLAVASTGTPTSGDVKTPVALLGLVAGMDIETIKEAMRNVEENFTTYKIGGGNVLINSFLTVASNILYDSEKANAFWQRIIANLPWDLDGDEKLEENIKTVIYTIIEFNITPNGTPIDPSVEYELTKFLSAIDVRTVKNFFKFAKNLDKYLSKNGKPFSEGLIEYLEKTREKKVLPGTFDPIGFVSVLTGSVSFQTRENLKKLSDPTVEEKIKIKDLGNLSSVIYNDFENLSLSKEFKEKYANVEIPPGFEGGEWNAIVETFNFYPDLRFANDEGVVKYIARTKLNALKGVINEVLNGIEQIANRNPEFLSKLLDLNLDKKKIKDAVFRSGVSVNDSVRELIWEMLYNDYDFDKVPQLSLQPFDSDRRELVDLKREVAQEVWKFVGHTVENIFTTVKNGGREKLVEFLKEIGMDRYADVNIFLEVLSSENGEDEGIPKVEFEDGRFYIDDIPVRFNFKVKFTNPDWEDILKTSYAYEYNYRILGGDNEEVIDVVNNKGYKEIYTNLAKEGKNFLVAPSRVPTLAVSILDTLTYLAKNKPADKDYQVLIRITDKSVENLLSKLDTEKLKKMGITVKSFKNHNLLDLEVKKFAKAVKRGELGMVVIAPAKTISRGVDLSMLDTIVIPGTVQGSGKDFAQLTARTFNNTDKHHTELYMFGTPVRLNYYKVFNNEFRSPAPQYTAIVQGRLLKKFEFIKAMMSGKMLNVLENNEKGRVIPFKEFEERRKANEKSVEYNFEVA